MHVLSVTSKCFLWKIDVRVLSALLQKLKKWGVSLLVLRPYTLHQLVCMAVTPGGSLFWTRYTRKPANSLLKTCQQSTWITGTLTYDLMTWRLICLVPMASSMCGGDQVRSTKLSALSMVVGMSWSGAAWVLQVLESYISLRETWTPTCTVKYCSRAWSLPPETGLQGSVPAWQWPQTHLQDNHCFTEEAEGKGDGLGKHISRLEPNRTSLEDPQAEGGGAQSLKCLPAPRCHHGGVEENSSSYLWSSGKLYAQESKGSSR